MPESIYTRTCTTCDHKIDNHDANECWTRTDGKEPDYCPTCREYWPCETAQAIEGAIKSER